MDDWELLGARLGSALSAHRWSSTTVPRDRAIGAEDIATQTLVTIIELEAALRAFASDGTVPLSPDGRSSQPLRQLLALAIDEGALSQLTFEQGGEIVRVRNALAHGQAKTVPNDVLGSVLERATAALKEIAFYLDAENDSSSASSVDSLLAFFVEVRPDAPHHQVYERLVAIGYEPKLAQSQSVRRQLYIRWVFIGPRGRVTLYQDESGLLLDSRVHREFASALPGAQPNGRRVLFQYDRTDTQAITSAADALKRRAGN